MIRLVFGSDALASEINRRFIFDLCLYANLADKPRYCCAVPAGVLLSLAMFMYNLQQLARIQVTGFITEHVTCY